MTTQKKSAPRNALTLEEITTLESLCKCKIGEGRLAMLGETRHTFARLIRKTLVDKMECAGIVVYRATNEGRKVYDEFRTANGWGPWGILK